MFNSNTTGFPVYSASEVIIHREKAVCITGHRAKLIVPYRNNSENLTITIDAVRMMLERYIDIVMQSGYNTLISGLAEGTDLWAAAHLLKRKRILNDNLIGVMPFLRHAEHFGKESLELLYCAERYADLLVTTSDDPFITYGKSGSHGNSSLLYQKRNYYMVDNSSVVIAFFCRGNYRSGTWQTMKYAEKKERKVFSFGLEEVYRILDSVGTDRRDVYDEVQKINFEVPGPIIFP